MFRQAVRSRPSRLPIFTKVKSGQLRYSSSSTSSPVHVPSRPARDLRGKVAIVTGAGSQGLEIGNGRASSILLAEDGASVVCVDKNLAFASQTVEMIKANLLERSESQPDDLTPSTRMPIKGEEEEAVSAIAISGDVTNPQDCEAIVDAAISIFGRLDILINVVGILGAKGTAVDVDLAEWTRGLDINVTSMVLMARYAIPAMLNEREGESSKKIKGSIVNIGSVAGLRGGTPHLLYPTSKGAVVNMTRAMAAQHGGQGIRVNCVCPGMLYTPMMYGPGGGMTDEMRQARRKRSLLETEGNAWDTASAIRFLAGDESRWITGAVLTVDAGASAAVSFSMT
ncbi:short-chain dehydrogenase reductase 2a [Rhypophila decipiens]|uniref:Short-chain dehydrogenase reductase 2a n=1 Tax=Rhypophila decipiens TaxID=261697 RepID=A0AAN6Y7M3_9PEZI|nr:short-chain dehydrogenase reductase 2a [Rhypophila decipiens]